MASVRLEVLAIAAVAVGVSLMLGKGNASQVGQAVGGAAVDMVDGVITGTVVGLGTSLGLAEPTDLERGKKALAAGNYLEASVYLPAGDFIAGMWGEIFN